ncbi:MAG: hypothetical protein Ct9H300mP27_07930 [Chloroflexota bacterium]|nr:MAG: hypothetical protein Ct9H300mP27_07930 [Chloroflexota bacterium]
MVGISAAQYHINPSPRRNVAAFRLPVSSILDDKVDFTQERANYGKKGL